MASSKKSLSRRDIGLKDMAAEQSHKDATPPDGPPSEQAKYWDKELTSARKREKDWRKQARNVTEIYEAGKPEGTLPFNILYANTETLLPVVYSNVPRPVVKRRQRSNNDPKALMASRVAQRLLEYFLDDGLNASPTFDDLAERACLQALVPGRGMFRLKYNAETETVVVEGESVDQLVSEYISAEYIEWDRILLGYARTWKQMPWIAFEHIMTRDELIDNFGEKLGEQIPLDLTTSETADKDSDDESSSGSSAPPADSEGAHLAQVYEIWCKTSKKVIFYAPSYKQDILKTVDDPLGLAGFYPCTEPLTMFSKISSMVPRPLYAFYEEQAEELNRITVRINKIVAALKVRGFYDGTIKGLDTLLKAEDNKLIPAENAAALLQGQTLDKVIWLMPLEKLVAVLQQLYQQRTQVKALIYEITGIADVIRGASAASETLGAQELKSNWATIRIKRLQRRVTKYLRDNLRIMAELAVSKLGPDTLAQMTGVKLPTAEDKAQAQMQLQQMQQQAMMAQQAPPPAPAAPGMPPQAPPPAAPPPPKPPQPDPKLLETLNMPTMVEVQELLVNDLLRSYIIDIETNSTLDTEATEDKQQVGEFLNAMAQFMSGIVPLIQSKVMPFEAVQAIMINVARRFRMSDEVEESLMKMQAPPAEDPNKGGKDIEGEKALMRAKVQMMQEEARIKKELGEMQLQLEREKMQLEREKMQLERQKVGHDTEMANAKHQANLQGLRNKAQVDGIKAQAAAHAAAQQPQPAAQPAAQPVEGSPADQM